MNYKKIDEDTFYGILCSLMPYGVLIHIKKTLYCNETTQVLSPYILYKLTYNNVSLLKNVKPLLRSMKSMSEEDKSVLWWHCNCNDPNINEAAAIRIDWLNKHHFDYLHLIEQGLAIETTDDENYTEYSYEQKLYKNLFGEPSTVNGWIDVNYDLPAENEHVVMCRENGEISLAKCFESNCWDILPRCRVSVNDAILWKHIDIDLDKIPENEKPWAEVFRW